MTTTPSITAAALDAALDAHAACLAARTPKIIAIVAAYRVDKTHDLDATRKVLLESGCSLLAAYGTRRLRKAINALARSAAL